MINAREIYRDSSLHVTLEITSFRRKFIDQCLDKSFHNKDVASLCKMSIFKTLLLITSFEIEIEANRRKPSGKVAVCYSYDI